MKIFSVLIVTLLFDTFAFAGGQVAQQQGLYCGGDADRVYLDIAPLSPVNGGSGDRKLILYDGDKNTHFVIETSDQNPENDARGLFIPIGPSKNQNEAKHGVVRATGILEFNGGIRMRISAVGFAPRPGDKISSLDLSFEGVQMDGDKVKKIIGHADGKYPPPPEDSNIIYGTIYNMDVYNGRLKHGINEYSDVRGQLLVELIKTGELPNGAVIAITVTCSVITEK